MPKPPEIDELIKSGVVKMGNDPSLEIRRIPVGIPSFDSMIGGGMPAGRVVLTYGPESTGKTLLAQIIAKAIQQTARPHILYMDMERSYDEVWWQQSGVDTTKLMISAPATAEQAIDIIRSVLPMPDLGMVVLDSIAAMTPMPEMDPEKSSEEKTIGLQARVVTLMFRQILPLLDGVVFLATNQMRESIGQPDELGSLPGGRAQRHYSHLILRTRRESWITDSNGSRIGYNMEVTPRKNKVAPLVEGITLPILFHGQLDLLTSHLEAAIERKLVTRRGPYYYYGALGSPGCLGLQALRQHFLDDEAALEHLKMELGVA